MSKQKNPVLMMLIKLLISGAINILICICNFFCMYEMNFSKGVFSFLLSELTVLLYIFAAVLHYLVYKKIPPHQKAANTVYLLISLIFINPFMMFDTVTHFFFFDF